MVYPVVETVQRGGVCAEVIAPAPHAAARLAEVAAQIGTAIAEGRAVSADPRQVVAEVTVSTPDGLTIAHGSAAIAIRVRRQDG